MREGFDKYGRSGAYHWRQLSPLHPKRFDALLDARYRAVIDLLRPEPAGPGVDIGCGDGALTARLARPGGSVVGVEAEAEALAWARRMTARAAPRRRPAWARGSALALPLGDGSCAWAVLADVIEHVERPAALLAEAARVVRPGGLVVVTTPRRVPGHAWDPEHHVHEYDDRELAALMRDSLDRVEVRGCVPMRLFRAYRVRHLLRTPVRVGVNLCAMAGFNPFRSGLADTPDERYGQLVAWGRRPGC